MTRSAAPARPRRERPVLVVDFGAQYAQLIARRVREAHVYSEIVPHTITAAEIPARKPAGRDLLRRARVGPRRGRPGHRPRGLRPGVPMLGICYGAQLIARELGGKVAKTGRGEYGRTELSVGGPGVLFATTARATRTCG